MDEESLLQRGDVREILAISFTQRMEVQVAARSHGDVPWLEGKPLAPLYGDLRIIDRAAEDRLRQRDLAC
jgi:hypothetical protein